MSYDVMYQEWLTARRAKDYQKADLIRNEFERLHGMTIFAEGPMVIEGVTARRMKASTWEKKYGNPLIGIAIATQDSKVLEYSGLQDRGYHYELSSRV